MTTEAEFKASLDENEVFEVVFGADLSKAIEEALEEEKRENYMRSLSRKKVE